MPTALTPLTPAELIKDIRVLDRIEHDWLQEGRLDSLTEEDITYKRGDLMDQLRQRFTTHVDADSPFGENWSAWQGDMDCDHNGFYYIPTVPVAYGATEIEAIENLLELIGEDEPSPTTKEKA